MDLIELTDLVGIGLNVVVVHTAFSEGDLKKTFSHKHGMMRLEEMKVNWLLEITWVYTAYVCNCTQDKRTDKSLMSCY